MAAWSTRSPAPLPAAAPAAAFSAGRAFTDVEEIARAPHPTGSPEAERVRAYVLRRFGELGLEASVHPGEAADAPRWAPGALAAAAAQNVVAVLPGRDRAAPAVAVMAHTDSVPNSPGAADDAAGVASALEIARALAADARAGRLPARDVVFVITDAEEAGLLGARAFFDTDPLARRIGAVVNLEARGDSGRAAMFQTGPRAGGLVRLYARAAPHPFAASFTAFLASLLPNDTDFTVARAHGLGGYNLAFIGDQLAYHTPLATPAHLDRRSLQSLGGQALGATRALADAERLPPPAADLAYADLPGLGVVGYSAVVGGWIALLAAAALLGWAARRAGRLGLVDLGAGLRGAALWGAAISAAALGPHLLGRFGGAGESLLGLYRALGRFDLLLSGAALASAGSFAGAYALAARALDRRAKRIVVAALLAAGAAGSLAGGLDLVGLALGAGSALCAWAAFGAPRLDPWSAWLGALSAALAVVFVLQVAAPPLAPLLLWPLLPGIVGAALVMGAGELLARPALVVAAVLAAAGVALALAWSQALATALGPAGLGAAALIAAMAGGPALAPFARLSGGGRIGATLALAAAAGGIALMSTAATLSPTAARPAATIAYAVGEAPAPGAPIARAWRVAPKLDAASRAVLGAGGRPSRTSLEALGGALVWSTPLAPWPERAPEVESAVLGGRLLVTVRPPPGARELRLRLDGPDAAALGDPRLDARGVRWPVGARGARTLRFAAPPPEGVTLSLSAAAHGEAALRATAVIDGWPPGVATPALPAGLMPIGDGGVRLVEARTELRW